MTSLLPYILCIPLFSIAVLLCWRGLSRNFQTVVALAAPLGGLLLLAPLVPDLLQGAVFQQQWQWLPILGLQWTLRLDALALLFAILIFGIGLLVIFYARYYLSATDPMPRFYASLLLFMLAMLGIVLSGNVLQLWMFWELTSISSFLLISYWSHRSDARKGARLALTVTAAGGLALLVGLILLGQVAGSYQLDVILSKGPQIIADAQYPLILVLILLGAFTKSAQFPFHFWLPNAMAAPTPVSAYLHSATMVKAGIFLLIRLYPAIAGTDLWFSLVSLAGLLTLLTGAYFALFQHDIKGLLAYSTISHLGLITLLLGLDTDLATVAAIFHIINHAVFKASLFMAAGIIDHETGSRDMRKINGLWHFMPVTASLAMVAAASMAGVPLLNGFLSKEMFFSQTLHQSVLGALSWLLPLLATLAAVFSVAYSARFIHDVFFNGKPVGLDKIPHEPPRYMRVPMEVLVALCIGVGVFPHWLVGDILLAASTAALQQTPPVYSLALWHGLNLPLLMSVVAFVAGIVLYINRKELFLFQAGFQSTLAIHRFEGQVQRLVQRCRQFSQWAEPGRLQWYIAAMLWAMVLLAGYPLLQLNSLQGERGVLPTDWFSAVLVVIMVLAAMATVIWQRQRLLALIMISVVGLMLSLLFIRFSAPDLALTQLAVEVATAVLLMLALYFLPHRSPKQSAHATLLRDLILAGSCAIVVGSLAYLMLTHQADSVSAYFLANAKSGGGGTNVVNVILVDFRGFDTFGEITVLGIAALGIYKLLTGIPRFKPSADADGRSWALDAHPLLLRVVSQGLLPLALLVSVYLFFRGHNLPGGGFVAGLVTAVALIMQYIAHGVDWVKPRLNLQFSALVASGILIAWLTGAFSWLFGKPFLTSWFDYFDIPLLGQIELASAIAFDLGVYLTVVGSTLLILANLGKLTTRHKPEHRGQV
jgi:multicomponent K+:H+ antiporter subunit A